MNRDAAKSLRRVTLRIEQERKPKIKANGYRVLRSRQYEFGVWTVTLEATS